MRGHILILPLSRPGTGSSGDHVSVQMSGDVAESGPGPANLPANAKLVARNFRYMRRKPTIMAYKPPEGKKGDNVTPSMSQT